MRGLTLGCACPTDSLKRQLCFAVCGYLLYLFCMQPNGKSALFIQIILSQDGRTSFEGRTLQDGPLVEDMVSG